MSEHAPLASAYFDALELAYAALSAPNPVRSRAGHPFTRLAQRITPEQGSPAALVELANDDGLALALVSLEPLALPDLLLLAAHAPEGTLPDEVHLIAAGFDRSAHEWISGFARRYGSSLTLHHALLDEGHFGWRLRVTAAGTVAIQAVGPNGTRVARLF